MTLVPGDYAIFKSTTEETCLVQVSENIRAEGLGVPVNRYGTNVGWWCDKSSLTLVTKQENPEWFL